MESSQNAGVDYIGSGYNNKVDVTEATTLTQATHAGIVVNVTATATITLPESAAGNTFIVRVGANDITVTIAVQSSDAIKGAGLDGTTAASVKFTDQPVGSFVAVVGGASDTYVVQRVNGDLTN